MKYSSKKAELCIVVRPEDRIIDEQRRVIKLPGKRVEFFNGRYETHDPEIIECLHNHPYRGTKFYEITEKDEKIIQEAKAIPIITGPMSVDGSRAIDDIITADLGKIEIRTRPTDTVAVSPELVRVIDERITAALSTIIDLLKKDTVKEENVMSNKPTKSFRCPYCGEPFTSGFKVGTHKKECSKRPNV